MPSKLQNPLAHTLRNGDASSSLDNLDKPKIALTIQTSLDRLGKYDSPPPISPHLNMQSTRNARRDYKTPARLTVDISNLSNGRC